MCLETKNVFNNFFFFSSRRRHTRCGRDWSSDVCSSDLCSLRTKENGVKKAAEMTGCGYRGKPKAGFPRYPRALGNRWRDSHIPAATATGIPSQNKTKKGECCPGSDTLTFRLIHELENAEQAHLPESTTAG